MMSFLGRGAAQHLSKKEARRGNGAGLQGNPREYAASKGHTAAKECLTTKFVPALPLAF
jgi:hypothetical protein